jgi:hypothetical protein
MLGRLVARRCMFSAVVEDHIGKDCGDVGGVAIEAISVREAIVL